MFSKILIANRGEIACRVIKTARAMGIKTVAVYSEADREALHVRMADEAVFIGPPAAAQSYLVIEKIIDACKQTGAEAVHPGYGFLSERAAFADALAAAGIVFIGPNKRAIEAMGDKIESKKAAAAAGVSTVPGHMGLIKDTDEAVTISRQVGYPVMIKASAGGGGKGMRIAWNDEEAREGFTRSRSEAASSFGDDRIFIEKFIVDPRHIEIQVLGDKHGNVVYLGERECSIQRRNQKVIEEAPSPLLDAATRKAMGEQAVALAKAVDYDTAGTVEFVAGQDKSFFFLEMNTRLQVEHPITELITGVDIVEQMIRVAAGEELAIRQSDVKLTGWAVESRIYAEDPFRNFLPSIGRLTRYRPPAEGPDGHNATVRNDTGVFEGGEVSMYYDPMIAKLCTHAATRSDAIAAMARALDRFELEGVGHNIPFLSAVMDDDRFGEGRLSTNYIAEEYPNGFQGADLDDDAMQILAAVGVYLEVIEARRAASVEGGLRQRAPKPSTDWVVTLGEGPVDSLRRIRAAVADAPHDLDVSVTDDGGARMMSIRSDWRPGVRTFEGTVNAAPVAVRVERAAEGWVLSFRGARLRVRPRRPRIDELARVMPFKAPPDTSKLLLCPMPGLIVSVEVAEGDDVQDGQILAVVEAMKMENVLRAERPGKVAKVHAKAGDSLAVDAMIMEFA